ncbi:MAG: hypothetical protein ABJE95_12995 [Byssovorax sp.]
MSEKARPLLSLYTLNRPELKAFSSEIRAVLTSDDREGLARILGLGAELSARVGKGPRAVDWFLRDEADPAAAPLYASLRRVAKKRALELAWTSAEPSLEGRLRAFDVLRDDARLASLIDKLLDAERLPWFLVRPGATSGWLDRAKREDLAGQMRPLRSSLPKELQAFADAIRDLDGDVVVHDLL